MTRAPTPPDRRTVLRTLGAVALAGRLPTRGDGAGEAARLDRIGLQLYTVRRELARDFDGTLGRVAAIGYAEVEFAGYVERGPAAVQAALQRTGLTAPSAHVALDALGDGWEKVLDEAQRIGHRYLVVPWIPEQERRTLDDYQRLAERFNRAGTAARAVGIRLAYHNQYYEFAAVDGRTPYEVLLAQTDPSVVAFELDLYWIVKGGGDPLAHFARHPGRFPMVHVKDAGPAPERAMVDVGRGVIDFRRVFARRAQAGIRHYFVEHDAPSDAFASVGASYQYLRHLEF